MNSNSVAFGNQQFLSEHQLQQIQGTLPYSNAPSSSHNSTQITTTPTLEMTNDDEEGEELLTPEETRQFIMLTNRMRHSLMGLN